MEDSDSSVRDPDFQPEGTGTEEEDDEEEIVLEEYTSKKNAKKGE